MLRHRYKPWLYCAPALLLILIIIVFPIAYTGYISLTNMNLYHWQDYEVIGLGNYARALFKLDSGFMSALGTTLLWTALNMAIQLALGFLIALGLNAPKLRLSRLYKTLLMVPWAMPAYISILLWRVGMFNTELGLLNKWLAALGLGKFDFLANNTAAFLSCMALNLWMALPFMICTIDGALQSVDRSLYESARLDGAGLLEADGEHHHPGHPSSYRPCGSDDDLHHIQAVRHHLPADPAARLYDRRYSEHRHNLRAPERLRLEQLRAFERGEHAALRDHNNLLPCHEPQPPGGLSMKRKVKERLGYAALNMAFVLLCAVTLVPILYAVSVSFSGAGASLSGDFSFIPEHPSFENYRAILLDEPFLLWLKNSLLLSAGTVLVAMLCAVTAAYACSRWRFRGRRPVLRALLVLNAFPQVLSLFAYYRILRLGGLLNSHAGLILIYAGSMCVFGIWNMKGYFDTIPVEIEEASKIDGANDAQMIWKIVLPLAKPAIVVTCVMVLITVWNEYLFATTFLLDSKFYSLAGGLYQLQSNDYTRSWPLFTAASILASIPLLLIFFKIQKYMVSGLTAGGVKG